MDIDIPAMEKQLRARLTQLQSRLESLKRDASQPHSDDSAEQAQERENDEVVDAIGIETRATIDAVNAALARIADGSYGECAACREPIAAGRLQALPQATRCVNCAG